MNTSQHKGLIKMWEISRLTMAQGGKKALVASQHIHERLHTPDVEKRQIETNQKRIVQNNAGKYDLPRGVTWDKKVNKFRIRITSMGSKLKSPVFLSVWDATCYYADKKLAIKHWTLEECENYLSINRRFRYHSGIPDLKPGK